MAEEPEEKQLGVYIEADVVLVTTRRLYGGIPQSPELLRAWIEAKGVIPEETLEDKIESLSPGEVDEKVEASSTGFRYDENGGGIYFRDFMLKQMLKEAATALGLFKAKPGTKTAISIGFVINPERIYVGKKEPDGYEEIQGRVRTMQGPRSILSRKAYFEPGLRIPFRLKMLKGKLTVKDIRLLLDHAGEFVGFGSCRSREEGKFEVEKFEIV